MQATVKQRLSSAVPPVAAFRLKTRAQRALLWRRQVEKAFAAARPASSKLDIGVLRRLEWQFPAPADAMVDADWTDEAIEARASRRVLRTASVLGDEWGRVQDVLETGVGDGVMSRIMATDHGKNVTANDHQNDELRDSVETAGVEFVKASASDLPLDDDCFDLVISHDAFEHFDDPVGAYHEAIRVARPGGLIYLRFGPLYRSSDGLHAGARLGVPFAPVLFEREDIDQHLAALGREPLHHDYCNEWTLESFRQLLGGEGEQVQPVHWFEHMDLAGMELISKHADVFKRCSENLDEFLVGYLEILLRKR